MIRLQEEGRAHNCVRTRDYRALGVKRHNDFITGQELENDKKEGKKNKKKNLGKLRACTRARTREVAPRI